MQQVIKTLNELTSDELHILLRKIKEVTNASKEKTS